MTGKFAKTGTGRSMQAEVAKLADAQDLKSCGPDGPCGFDPHPRYQIIKPYPTLSPPPASDRLEPSICIVVVVGGTL